MADNKEAEADVRKVKSGIKSPFSAVSAVFIALFEIVHEDLGVKLAEIATLAGEAGKAKRRQIAEFMRDVIRGALTSAIIGIGSQIGLVVAMPQMKAPEGGMWFRIIIPVNWMMSWVELIKWACPQTGDTWEIMKLTDPHPVGNKRGTTIEEYFLLWMGKSGTNTVAQAQAYAPEELEYAHGRAPVSIIAAVPDLATQLAKYGFPYKDVGVVTGSGCGGRKVVRAWRLEYGDRHAFVNPVTRDWHGYYVFAFSRKP